MKMSQKSEGKATKPKRVGNAGKAAAGFLKLKMGQAFGRRSVATRVGFL
jgi:hypothetical protein